MNVAQAEKLVVHKWYAASPELVFRAFTEARLLEKWFTPSPDITMHVLHLDVRAGGSYRFTFHRPDGTDGVVSGEYRTITPGQQLVMSWLREPPDPHAGHETLVTIDFRKKDGGTEVVVRHENFPDLAERQLHENGWTGALQRLDPVLSVKND